METSKTWYKHFVTTVIFYQRVNDTDNFSGLMIMVIIIMFLNASGGSGDDGDGDDGNG